MVVLFAVAVLLMALGTSQAQKVKQCLCSDIEPCSKKFLNTWEPCLDTCQHHVATLGGDFQQLKHCFLSKRGLLEASITCTEAQNEQACAKNLGAVKEVPKRYPETMQIAAMSEINRMINKMGIEAEAKEFLGAGKKMFGCMRQCMGKKSGNCEKKFKCGLDLPPDNVLVQSVKQCAINSGFNTANAQGLCNCAVKAGVKQLTGICPKLIIS